VAKLAESEKRGLAHECPGKIREDADKPLRLWGVRYCQAGHDLTKMAHEPGPYGVFAALRAFARFLISPLRGAV